MSTDTPSQYDYVLLNKLLNKAKIGVMQNPNSTFFTTILFSMVFVWDEACKTAWTTGLRLGFSPKFFLECTPEERIFVLVHECCHSAYLHIDPYRKGGRDHSLWNQAGDHVINLDLEARGFKMPSWILKDPRFTDMSTEQVYNILLAEKMAGQPQQQNGMEDIRSPDEGDGVDSGMAPSDYKRALDDILIRAQMQSKMQGDAPGSVPGAVELYLDKLLNPKLPWQEILRKWLKSLNKSDYSFKKPNRRFFPKYYLPSLWSEGAMCDFQAWVDISGSETDEDFLRFISEIHGIFKMMQPKKIELGQFDTIIQSITPVKSIMDLANVKFHGRGGTRITEVLDHIEKTRPKVAMIFSDGGFRHDREKCSVNILWMIHDNPDWTAPFGRVIHYKTHTE